MRSRKAIYNILTTLLSQAIIFFSGFVVRKLIIQSYGSSVNGLITSVTHFISYITFLESGIGPVIKAALYKPLSKKNYKEIANVLYASEKFFKSIAKIFIVYLLLLMFIYPIMVNGQFDWFFTVSLILIISISTFSEYYFGMTYKLYLNAEQKSYVVSFIQIFTYVLSTILIYVLIKLNCSIHVVKLLSGFIFIMRPILQNIYVKKKYNISLNSADKNYKLKQKWDGLAQHIASIVHANADVAILTVMSNLIQVSIYSIYSLVTNGLRLLTQSFSESIEAVFGNMIANNEDKNLRKKFDLYETLYFSVVVIIYGCAFVLITPFVSVYTLEIKDVNYCQNLFGSLMVVSEFCWAIRQPYNNLIKAKGHFRETRKGAWLEAIINIVLSVVFVAKLGLVGVAIGTLVAMVVRSIEFIYHANKYILGRSLRENVKKILLVIIEFCLIVLISKQLPMLLNVNYSNWIVNALMVFLVASVISVLFKFVFYFNGIKTIKSVRNLFNNKNRD